MGDPSAAVSQMYGIVCQAYGLASSLSAHDKFAER